MTAARRVAAAALPLLLAVLAGSAGLAALAGLDVVAAPTPARAEAATPRQRVLVVTLPGATWEELADPALTHTRELLAQSATANLSLRTYRTVTRSGDGYATIGAGTRAKADVLQAGLALAPDEPFENGDAAAAFERRAGTPLDGAAGQLAVGPLLRANATAAYEAELGLLGETLAAHGVVRGVVANADTALDDDPLARHREAALAAIDPEGVVTCGRVDTGLVRPDRRAAYGLALDRAAAVAAFEECWQEERAVVVVEASDLARADAYRSVSRVLPGDELRAEALRAADALVGALLERVDPATDAVVLVTPSSPAAQARLGVAAVRAPGHAGRLLVSGTTRRLGTVALTDVAPTILDLLDLPRPEQMDGRPMVARGGRADVATRIDAFADADAAARARDAHLDAFLWILVVAIAALTTAAFVLRASPRGHAALRVGALTALMVPPLSLVAALFPFWDWGFGALLAFCYLGGLVIAGLLELATRGRIAGIVTGLGIVIAVPVLGALVFDSRFQVSTMLGNSPIVGGRFSGFNNITWAMLVAASILIAAYAIPRVSHRAGNGLVIALFTGVLVVDGMPMWGSDVGGLLAGVPIFVVAGLLLTGRRVRVRTAALTVGGAVAVTLGFAVLDLARPSEDRTHLGRLLERIGGQGGEGFLTVIERKATANLAALKITVWWAMVVVVVAAAAVAWFHRREACRALADAEPRLPAAIVSLAVAAVVGTVLNDSGIAVPGSLAMVAFPAVLYRWARPEEAAGPPAGQPPDGSRTRPANSTAPVAVSRRSTA